jgi:predicted GNAT family acetyltransferase
MIREAMAKDFDSLMQLYTQLHDNPIPPQTEATTALWQNILADKDHHIIVAELDGKIVSSCVCVVIPNLTHGQQPYALIENVVTYKAYRKQGLAYRCASKLILECLKRGLYPSWDARTMISVALAEKLGYVYSHEYVAYEVNNY